MMGRSFRRGRKHRGKVKRAYYVQRGGIRI